MRTFLTILSISLFYLGALNTHLARFVGTCTQGGADNLAGIVLTAILYIVAIMTMIASRRERRVLLAIIPVIPVLAWQTVFSVRLAYGLLWKGLSACQVLIGGAYPMDGKEFFFGIAWITVTLLTLVSLVVIWRVRAFRTSG